MEPQTERFLHNNDISDNSIYMAAPTQELQLQVLQSQRWD